MKTPPLVSVGLFVYNGEASLDAALSSILNQTLEDFELIISDDSSTDRTPEICRRHAIEDSRIRYYRNQTTMGSDWNAGRVYSLAVGKYFKWATHEDMIQPDYLRLCVDALEADQSLVLAHSLTRVIDRQGHFLENCDEPLRTNSPDPVIRLRDLLLLPHRCYPIFGLIHMDALRKLPPRRRHAHNNRALLLRLALFGRYYEVPEFLFISMRHAGQSSWSRPAPRSAKRSLLGRGSFAVGDGWDRTRAQTIRFPEWNLLKEYFHCISSSQLAFRDRARSYGLLARWLIKHRRRMARDLEVAADQALFNVRNRRTIAANAVPAAPAEPALQKFYLELDASGGELL